MRAPGCTRHIDTISYDIVYEYKDRLHSVWVQEKRSKRNSSENFRIFKKRLVEYSEIRNKLFTHKKNKKRAMEKSLS